LNKHVGFYLNEKLLSELNMMDGWMDGWMDGVQIITITKIDIVNNN